MIKQNFGETPATFDEAQCRADNRGDVKGAALQPTLVHRKWWSMLGG